MKAKKVGLDCKNKRKMAKKPNFKQKGYQDIREFLVLGRVQVGDDSSLKRSSELGQDGAWDCISGEISKLLVEMIPGSTKNVHNPPNRPI